MRSLIVLPFLAVDTGLDLILCRFSQASDFREWKFNMLGLVNTTNRLQSLNDIVNYGPEY